MKYPMIITSVTAVYLLSPPSHGEPQNKVYVSPFGGYAFVNYAKKVEVLDPDLKETSIRPGDLSYPLVDLIRRAERSMDIASYIYSTMTAEHQAILDANQRGVKIRLYLDPSIKGKHDVPIIMEVLKELKDVRPIIPVKMIDPEKAEKLTGIPFKTMHEKFGIIDGRHVFNGSANIDISANLKYTEDRFFFLDNPEMVRAFQGEFDRLWEMGQWLIRPDEKKVLSNKK